MENSITTNSLFNRIGVMIEKSQDIVKDHYVIEFIGLPELSVYSESELEARLINHLQTFLLELGKGFAFVGRRVRFTFDEQHSNRNMALC